MLAGYLRKGVGFRILSNPSMGMPEKGAKMLLGVVFADRRRATYIKEKKRVREIKKSSCGPE